MAPQYLSGFEMLDSLSGVGVTETLKTVFRPESKTMKDERVVNV